MYKITYCVFFAIDHVLVSFVTIATTGAIFSLQFTKNRLAAGLRPDPLGELERSPKPPSRKTGSLLLRGGEGDRMGGEGWEGEGREEMGGRRERKMPPNANSWIRPCTTERSDATRRCRVSSCEHSKVRMDARLYHNTTWRPFCVKRRTYTKYTRFLLSRDACVSAVVWCPSVTFVYCVETAADTAIECE